MVKFAKNSAYAGVSIEKISGVLKVKGNNFNEFWTISLN